MMKAGKYWIGDLCYVLGHHWDEFCDITIDGSNCLNGEFKLSNGIAFATYGTAYGDGAYLDQNGNEYGVDAGLIGCVLVSDIINENESLDSGHIFEFTNDFETAYNDGVIQIGHIFIDTDPSENDYEEECDND